MNFSKLKALLRKAAARTVDELWSVVAKCLSAFTPEECQHDLRWSRLVRQFGGLAKVDRVRFYAANCSVICAVA